MQRNIDRARAQFELERVLRQRILNSSTTDRGRVTSEVYGELFDKFPDHSVFIDDEGRARVGQRDAGMVFPLTKSGDRVLEVGCGRGDVLRELAKEGRECVGLEPSEHMRSLCPHIPGVTICPGSASPLQFADATFNLVFSQQVIEHLHPQDVPAHLSEAFRILRPGGHLAIETPNCRTGPQDISRGFTRRAEGLHLKEWSIAELAGELRRAGFVKIRGLLAPPAAARRLPALHRLSRVPVWVKTWQDMCLEIVRPLALRTLVAKMFGLDDVFLIGLKQ